MSSVNLRNVSDEELIAEMKKRFIIIGFYNKDDIDVDGLDKYSYEEINKHLTTCDIDGDYYYQEMREALLEKFGDEEEPDEELLETKCGCKIIINSREHDECRCDGDGENWICADCYDGEYDESDDEETELIVWTKPVKNKCDVCCEECDDEWCEECKLNVWECKYCGDKINNEIKKCGCEDEKLEDKYEYVVKTWVYETETKSIEYNGLYETDSGVKSWDTETEARDNYDDAIFNGQYISVMLIKIDPDSNENRETIISEWEESLSEYEDPDGDEEEEWFDIEIPVKKNNKETKPVINMEAWVKDFTIGEEVLVMGCNQEGKNSKCYSSITRKGIVKKLNAKSVSVRLYGYSEVWDYEAIKNQTYGSNKLIWGQHTNATKVVHKRKRIIKKGQGHIYESEFVEGRRSIDYGN